MDNGIRVGHFLGDGEDIFLPLGFIPDYFRMCDIDSTTSNAAVALTEWFERMEDDEASGSQEGWTLGLGTLGFVTLHSDDQGISAYDTGSQQPASGFDSGELSEWTASTAVDVKTGTKAGSYAKPTVGALDDTGGVADRDAIFENVGASDGSTDSSEPVWPSAIGGRVVDSAAIWEKVNTPIFRGGYQGVAIRAELQTNSHEYYYLAIRAHDSIDHGDVDGWANGIDQDWS
jgi:hypothetical protein